MIKKLLAGAFALLILLAIVPGPVPQSLRDTATLGIFALFIASVAGYIALGLAGDVRTKMQGSSPAATEAPAAPARPSEETERDAEAMRRRFQAGQVGEGYTAGEAGGDPPPGPPQTRPPRR